MKYIITTLLLLTTIAGIGQKTDSLTAAAIGFRVGPMGSGPYYSLRGCAVSFITWENRPVKNSFDSGDVQIYGDTIQVIRMLAKKLDSMYRSFETLRELGDRAIDATVHVRDGGITMARYSDALDKYYRFAWPPAPKAKSKRKKEERQ